MIGKPAGALEHLALIVGAVLNLVFAGDGCRLRLGEVRSTGIGEVAERDQLEAVTGRTNLAVDLEPALQLRLIVHAERSGK